MGPSVDGLFSPKILGLKVEMLGLFSGSLGLCLKIGFGARTDVFEFCCVFWCLGLFLVQPGSGNVD